MKFIQGCYTINGYVLIYADFNDMLVRIYSTLLYYLKEDFSGTYTIIFYPDFHTINSAEIKLKSLIFQKRADSYTHHFLSAYYKYIKLEVTDAVSS